jgi:hypothetical protein
VEELTLRLVVEAFPGGGGGLDSAVTAPSTTASAIRLKHMTSDAAVQGVLCEG